MDKTGTDLPRTEYPPSSFSVGATMLISLGCVVLAIGVVTAFIPPDESAPAAGASLHRHGRPQLSGLEKGGEEAKQDFQADQQRYRIAEGAVCPPLQAMVFTRGPAFACYHWRKDCPLLHNLRKPLGANTLRYVTRRKAEAQGYDPCYYCCELERRERSGELLQLKPSRSG